MFERTRALCDFFLELGVPGFDLAVYQDGKCILRYMNGYSDVENKISLFFGNHLLSSPAQGLRSLLYRIVRAELIDNEDFEEVYIILKELYNYNLTY